MKETGPRVCVMQTDGTNCDIETAHAFELAGGRPDIVHINELRDRSEKLTDFNILALPGGFSYGDDTGAGRVLGVELITSLADDIDAFVQRDKGLVLGVCNGFQVLVRTGLLPFGETGDIQAALSGNESGKFECRWVDLRIDDHHPCEFTNRLDQVISYQVAHGEGQFVARPDTVQQIEDGNQVVFRYADTRGNPTEVYPDNPNGSAGGIAGICDPTGRILGLMPHPERYVNPMHHPNWRRMNEGAFAQEPPGLTLFKNMVEQAGQRQV